MPNLSLVKRQTSEFMLTLLLVLIITGRGLSLELPEPGIFLPSQREKCIRLPNKVETTRIDFHIEGYTKQLGKQHSQNNCVYT